MQRAKSRDLPGALHVVDSSSDPSDFLQNPTAIYSSKRITVLHASWSCASRRKKSRTLGLELKVGAAADRNVPSFYESPRRVFRPSTFRTPSSQHPGSFSLYFLFFSKPHQESWTGSLPALSAHERDFPSEEGSYNKLDEPLTLAGTICRADWVEGKTALCRTKTAGGGKREDGWTPRGCINCNTFEASPCRDIFKM